MKSLPRVRHERLQVSELQARVAELEEELAGARTAEVSDDHVVVGQLGLETAATPTPRRFFVFPGPSA
jgi:hypothetical protein